MILMTLFITKLTSSEYSQFVCDSWDSSTLG